MSPILGVLLFITLVMAAPPPTSSSVPCKTDSECSSGHCCLLGASRFALPSCSPFRQKSEDCRVNAETITTNLTYPDGMRLEIININFILCPCNTGLNCNERGICN